MTRRSAKGEIVDFDLIKAKSQMAKQPVPDNVQSRRQVIDKRLRRKINSVVSSPVNNVTTAPVETKEPEKSSSKPEENNVESKPSTERTVSDETQKQFKTENIEEKVKKRTRQKARPKTDPSGDIKNDTTDTPTS